MAVGAILLVLIVSYWAGAKNILQLPVPDLGEIIIPTEMKDWLKAGEVLERNGLRPQRMLNTTFAKRAFMDRRIIVNATAQANSKEVRAAIGFVVRDPLRSAAEHVKWLRNQGFSADFIPDPDHDIPENSMVFLTTSLFPDRLIVYRKLFFRMGRKPSRWHWDEARRQAAF